MLPRLIILSRIAVWPLNDSNLSPMAALEVYREFGLILMMVFRMSSRSLTLFVELDTAAAATLASDGADCRRESVESVAVAGLGDV